MNSESKAAPSTKNEKRRWKTPQLTMVGDIKTFVRSGVPKTAAGSDGNGGSGEKRNSKKDWDTWDNWDSGDNWDSW